MVNVDIELLKEMRSEDPMQLKRALMREGVRNDLELLLLQSGMEQPAVAKEATSLIERARGRVQGIMDIKEGEESLEDRYRRHQSTINDFLAVVRDPVLQRHFPDIGNTVREIEDEQLEIGSIFAADLPSERKTSILQRHEFAVNKKIVSVCWEYISAVGKPSFRTPVPYRADRSGARGQMKNLNLTDVYRNAVRAELYKKELDTGVKKYHGHTSPDERGFVIGTLSNQTVMAPSPYAFLRDTVRWTQDAKGDSQTRLTILLLSAMDRLDAIRLKQKKSEAA